jgi:hypothetical protein
MVKTPATFQRNSHYWTCLGHLGQCSNKTNPICVVSPKVVKASKAGLFMMQIANSFANKNSLGLF